MKSMLCNTKKFCLVSLSFLSIYSCASSSSHLENEANLAEENFSENDAVSQGNNFSQTQNQFSDNNFAELNDNFNQGGQFNAEAVSNDQGNYANNEQIWNQGENNLALSQFSNFANENLGNAGAQNELSYSQFSQNMQGGGYDGVPTNNSQWQNQAVLGTEEYPSQAASINPSNNVQNPDIKGDNLASSGTPPIPLMPVQAPSKMTWIGYDYMPTEKKVILNLKFSHLVTPTWQTVRDGFGQTEYQMFVPAASASSILRRDLDARQFYSPLSYVKVQDALDGLTVKMTLRDDLQPEVWGDDTGEINIQFPIPEKYLQKVASLDQGAVASAEDIEDPQVLETVEDPSEVISVEEEVYEDDIEELNAPPSEGDFNQAPDEYLNGEPAEDFENSFPENSLENSSFNPKYQDIKIAKEVNIPSGSQKNQNRNDIRILRKSSFFAVTVAQDFIENEEPMNTGGSFNSGNGFSGENPFGSESSGDFQSVTNNTVNVQANNSSIFTSNGGNSFTDEPTPESHVELNNNLIESQDAGNMAGGSIKGKALTLSFRGAPLNEVIRAIMGETGINFTMPPEIGKIPIYIEFKQVFWVDALKAILQTYNLGFVDIAPNLVRIDQLERLNAEKTMLEEIRRSTVRLTDTKILVVRLSYARAEALAPRVKEILKADSEIDPRVNISADNRTNSLYIEAIPIVLAKVKAIVEKLDHQTPQVKIESRIVEIIKTSGEFLGVNWSQPFNYNAGRGLGFGSVVFPNSVTSSYSVDTGGAAPRVGNINLLVGSINNTTELDLRLAFEESKGTTEILESSSITVQDSTEAKISAGTTDYFRSNSVFDKESMATIEYFLTLAVTPNITSDGNVLMQLKVKSTNPRASQAARAESSSTNREVETTLIRGSGETAAIGGLYTTSKVEKISGIPFLSSIPIIGRLFKSVENSESRRELVVLITPTIVNYSGQSAIVGTSELAGSPSANSVLGVMGQGPGSQQFNNFNANQGNNYAGQEDQGDYNENNNNQGSLNQSQDAEVANSQQQNNGQFNNFNNNGTEQSNGEFVGNEGQGENFINSNNNSSNNDFNNQSFGNNQGQNNTENIPLDDEEFGNEEF